MNLKNLFVRQNTMKYTKTNGHKSEHEWINESVQDSMFHSFSHDHKPDRAIKTRSFTLNASFQKVIAVKRDHTLWNQRQN